MDKAEKKDLPERELLLRLYYLEEQGLISFDRKGAELMDYEGRFSEVLRRLYESLKTRNASDSLVQFMDAPRLIRGIIDYAIEGNKYILGIKNKLEEICRDIYTGENIRARQKILSINFPKSLLEFKLKEEKDIVSWNSYSPSRNEDLILNIKGDEENQNTFDYVVIDGHDGYRSGFAIAQALDAKTISLRNSSSLDITSGPRTLAGESAQIRDILEGKKVLIYGEDSSTGRAINSLYKFVTGIADPEVVKTAATIIINGKERSKREIDYFGERKSSFN